MESFDRLTVCESMTDVSLNWDSATKCERIGNVELKN